METVLTLLCGAIELAGYLVLWTMLSHM